MHSKLTINPLDTARTLSVRKTFRRRPKRLLNVLYTNNLNLMSRGKLQLQLTASVDIIEISLLLTLNNFSILMLVQNPVKHLTWRLLRK